MKKFLFLLLKFFLFNIILSLFFIFSHKLFEHNFHLANSILWIILMTGLPFGAALFVKFQNKLQKYLPYLFLLGFLWLLLTNIIFLNIIPWHEVTLPFLLSHILLFLAFQGTYGILIFGPAWMCAGILELHLYKQLTHESKKNQWFAYLSSVLGLLGGQALHVFVFPVPNPFWIGVFLIVTFSIYIRCYSFPISWCRIYLTTFLILIILAFGTFIQYPAANLNKRFNPKVPYRILYDQWTYSNHFTIITSQTHTLLGFYNGAYHWKLSKQSRQFPIGPEDSQDIRLINEEKKSCLDVEHFIATLIPEKATIGILGVGGGEQLASLLKRDPHIVYAVDIIPNLFTTMIRLGISLFTDPRIAPITQDGRIFIKNHKEDFDLIYLPYTESIFELQKSLFDPADHLFTLEAFHLYRQHLKPEGLLVLKKVNAWHNYAPILKNYYHTMKAAGFNVRYYVDPCMFILIGTLNERTMKHVDHSLAKVKGLLPSLMNRIEPGKILVDDKPFFAGVLFSSMEKIIIWLLPTYLILLSGVWIVLKKIKSTNFLEISPLLCGMNYTSLLLSIQLLMFFNLPNPLDASLLGSVVFLIFVGIGALLYENKKWLLVITIIIIGLMGVMGWGHLPLLGLETLALWSGGFFPKLIHRFQKHLSRLLILDGIGAAMAGALYLIVPTFWGIRIFLYFVVIIFGLTFWSVFKNERQNSAQIGE